MSSLCWCQGILSGYDCVLIFPNFFCIIHLRLQHEYICMFISVDFNLPFFLFLWFSHAYAGSWKPLRLPELSFHQYSKALLLFYHTRLSVSAKSSCGWAVAEFLVCWFTEFSGISYSWGVDSGFFSASARQKSHDFQVKFSVMYWIYCITWSDKSPLYMWITIFSLKKRLVLKKWSIEARD